MTTTRRFAGPLLLWALLAAVVLAGPVGCGRKEIDALKDKVAALEQELAATKTELAETTQALEEARANAEKSDTKEEALVEQLNKVRVERDKLKQELTALKRRR
jgi:uncharacterized coiled-coil DUF342 family protein